MKTCVLRLHGVCLITQPVRTKVRYNSANQQATSSATVEVKNNVRKFAVCDGFVEFMVRKHQEELQRLSMLIREEAVERHSSYLQVCLIGFNYFLAYPGINHCARRLLVKYYC